MRSAVEAEQVEIQTYDQDTLASVRGYEWMPLETAIWPFSHSVTMWLEAFETAVGQESTFNHSERGLLTLSDLVQSNCHDVTHHEWDIRRSLAA